MASVQSIVSPIPQPTGPKSVSRPKRWSDEVEEGIMCFQNRISKALCAVYIKWTNLIAYIQFICNYYAPENGDR